MFKSERAFSLLNFYCLVLLSKYSHTSGKVWAAASIYKDANGKQVGPKVVFLRQD